jgi:peroxiredoxin
MRSAVAITCLFASLLMEPCFGPASPAQGQPDRATEERIVQYLHEHVRPGEPLVISDLYNNVFKTPEERKVLDRLFNTVFKIPLFVAQHKAAAGQIPSLADIARQFNLPVEGEASVILSIITTDPRIPKFITRDPATGEITSVDVEAVKRDPRFGKALERTLAGWVGRNAPPFNLELLGGGTLSSADLKGMSYLVYFWFSGCPPCARMAPQLVELQRQFGSRNFTVLAVNADRLLELETTDAQRKAYIEKAGFSFPVGHLNKKMHEDYGNVSVYPTMFLVDSSGVIRKHYVNYQPLKTLSDDVAAIAGAYGLRP